MRWDAKGVLRSSGSFEILAALMLCAPKTDQDKVPSKPAVDDSVEVHDPELRGHCDLSVKVSMLLHDDKPKCLEG